MDQATAEYSLNPDVIVRYGSILMAGMGAFSFLMARYGADGIFVFSRPWRLALFVGTLIASGFAGFRSLVILISVSFLLMFWIQKLWQTRVLLIVTIIVVLLAAGLVAFSNKMPIQIQRTFSFIPILDIDPLTRQTAQDSTEWRLEIWREALPMVPRYLFYGKGYVINPDELYQVQVANEFGTAQSWEGAFIAGDYHNGPLSLIIPFGIYAVVAFLWFGVASARLLYRYYQECPPELKRINGFLFSLFVARLLFFFFVFGSFQAEFFYFTGIIGIAVALNGRPASVVSNDDSSEAGEPQTH